MTGVGKPAFAGFPQTLFSNEAAGKVVDVPRYWREYAGAITGAMNTATFVAAFGSSVAYGYIVRSYGYDAPFLPMIALLAAGAVLWLRVDAGRKVVDEGPLPDGEIVIA